MYLPKQKRNTKSSSNFFNAKISFEAYLHIPVSKVEKGNYESYKFRAISLVGKIFGTFLACSSLCTTNPFRIEMPIKREFLNKNKSEKYYESYNLQGVYLCTLSFCCCCDRG
jgi:hypothetical protein